MIKKTITYTDYNGVERTVDCYFSLTETELLTMELGTAGTLSETLRQIIAAKDTPTLIKAFQDIILKSYGRKSPDGNMFEKSETISREFSQTEAYNKLFMELVTDDEAAAKFVNGLIPTKLAKQMSENGDKQAIPQMS